MENDKNDYLQTRLKNYLENLPNSAPDGKHDVQRAMKFLRKYLFHNTCKVGLMKKKCKLPQNNFSLRFKRYVGMSPVSYISHHRIEAAKLLLSDKKIEDLSISKIGFAVGYERPSTFSTIFFRKVGTPPGIWRKQQLKM